jgi:hypothetical protein
MHCISGRPEIGDVADLLWHLLVWFASNQGLRIELRTTLACVVHDLPQRSTRGLTAFKRWHI